MKLAGDEKGLADLREIKEKKMDYLKFLITSAKTNFDRKAKFQSIDGERNYYLNYDPLTDEFKVEPAK